jgi:pyruvate ferredoxin oxidoreductase beta subunit
MNTGIQRSSATPKGAWATTSEVGDAIPGKEQRRKDLTAIMAAHDIPYVAQASIAYWRDLVVKAEKAFAVEGPAFLNIFAPCPRGWRAPYNMSVELAKLAVETGFWPLYEVEDGEWKCTKKVRDRKPVTEFMESQGRFKHLFKPENAALLEEIQADTDRHFERVMKRCGVE